MKKRLISIVLSLIMVLSACVLCFTGCASEETDDTTSSSSTTTSATTLVMWCVTEDGTDNDEAQAVAKAMSEITKSKFKAQLIVKYLTEDEYYDALESALAMQEQALAEKTEATARKKEEDKAAKSSKTEEEEPTATPTEEEEEEDDEVRYDEDGDPIIDTTVYPDVTDYQVDILYLSGYTKYKEYIENEWLSDLSAELTGNSKKIANYVSTALLSAAQYNGKTYAIPNNNVIGEYTYMLIDRELFDKYYYTGSVDTIGGITDIADFLDDIASYEPDVLPINGTLEYCTGLIADYWDIDPETLAVSGDFSIIGYAHKATDKINRGDSVLEFSNLLASTTYKAGLEQLMEYKFKGYYGEAAEGQKCAVTFAKGDAADAVAYSEKYYPVVVEYPRAADDDIYGNMFAVSAFTSSLEASMEVVTLLNTNAEFRNLFQYGEENTNYTLNADGTVSMTRANAYNMDIAKTGNEFIAYVPEGMSADVWTYAKEQNRESLVDPLLGFSFEEELIDESEDAEAEVTTEDEYTIEVMNTALIKHISEISTKVWERISKCTTMEEYETTMKELTTTYSQTKDKQIGLYCKYAMVEQEYEIDTEKGEVAVKTDADGVPVVDEETLTVTTSVKLKSRTAVEKVDGIEETVTQYYLIKTKTVTPYQVYYRWMQQYGYLPASYAGN